MPWWWSGPIHSSHRAALLFKDYDYYSQFGWEEKPATSSSTLWPIIDEKDRGFIGVIGP